jgi:hypothetical protein
VIATFDADQAVGVLEKGSGHPACHHRHQYAGLHGRAAIGGCNQGPMAPDPPHPDDRIDSAETQRSPRGQPISAKALRSARDSVSRGSVSVKGYFLRLRQGLGVLGGPPGAHHVRAGESFCARLFGVHTIVRCQEPHGFLSKLLWIAGPALRISIIRLATTSRITRA